MKVIVAGSRTFDDYEFVKKSINDLINEQDLEISEIVSGHASGVDKLGEQYAREYNLPLVLYPAKWGMYGNSAGPRRNKEMATYADYLIAFFNGHSRGTGNMISCMVKQKKPHRIIKI